MDLRLSEQLEHLVIAQSSEDVRDYIGASTIGHDCPRFIYYQSKGEAEQIAPRLRRIFDHGKAIESMLLDYIEQLNYRVIRPTEQNNMLFCCDRDLSYFKGHMDGVLLDEHDTMWILEIKTCKDTSFKEFKSKGLKKWNMSYYAQLQSYMGMTHYTNACLLAYNKNDSSLHSECVIFDEDYYDYLKTRAHQIFKSEELPERINKNPCFYKCAQCKYKTICHTGD